MGRLSTVSHVLHSLLPQLLSFCVKYYSLQQKGSSFRSGHTNHSQMHCITYALLGFFNMLSAKSFDSCKGGEGNLTATTRSNRTWFNLISKMLKIDWPALVVSQAVQQPQSNLEISLKKFFKKRKKEKDKDLTLLWAKRECSSIILSVMCKCVFVCVNCLTGPSAGSYGHCVLSYPVFDYMPSGCHSQFVTCVCAWVCAVIHVKVWEKDSVFVSEGTEWL